MVVETGIFLLVITIASFVTVLSIGGWVLVSVVRGTARVFTGRTGLPRPGIDYPGQCPSQGCGAINPLEARFCRRCGGRIAFRTRRRSYARGSVLRRPPTRAW